MDKSIPISDDLIKEAQEATGESDERVAVEKALKAFVKTRPVRSEPLPLSSYAGQFEFVDGFDPIKERRDRGLPD